MRITENNRRTAQEIQDHIFRRMPVRKKLEMLDGFFRFAKELSAIGGVSLERKLLGKIKKMKSNF